MGNVVSQEPRQTRSKELRSEVEPETTMTNNMASVFPWRAPKQLKIHYFSPDFFEAQKEEQKKQTQKDQSVL